MNNKVLKLIKNIIENPSNELKKVVKSGTRANIMGDTLEEYIKNAFANTFYSGNEKLDIHEEFFSWTGNQNNPPDMIIKNDIAVEVKKNRGFWKYCIKQFVSKSYN